MALQKCELNLDRTKRELRPHGLPQFPCAAYFKGYTNRADDEIPWHWHEEIEIMYIVEGVMHVQVPGKTYRVRKGQLLFLNAGILHYAAAEEYCELQSLVFHPLLLTGTEDSVFAQEYIGPLTHCTTLDSCLLNMEAENGAFTTAFQAMVSENLGYEFLVRENIAHICMFLYRQYRDEIRETHAAENQDTLRIRVMLDYIHSHYPERLELAQIARQAGIGERECLRCFQRMLQISPMQYLLKYRISQGASMLLAGNGSIAEIAVNTGFDSPSNFTQMFKRYYKCTPRQYRKSYEKER